MKMMSKVDMLEKRIFVHLGSPKAGSSAIQGSLERHREWLLENGYLPFIDQERVLNKLFSGLYERDEGRTKRIVFEYIYDNITHGTHSLIFSDESILGLNVFATGVSYNENIRMAKNIFGGFRNITFLIYLRRQDTLIESMYQQLVKMNLIHCLFDEYAESVKDKLDFKEIIDSFKRSFPNSKFRIRPYELVIRHDDIFRDFLRCTGIKDIPMEIRSRTENPGLNEMGLKILESCNKVLSDSEQVILRQIVVNDEATKRTRDTGYGYFSKEKREQILLSYHETNKRLFEEYRVASLSEFQTWERMEGATMDRHEETSLSVEELSMQFLAKKLIQRESMLRRLRSRGAFRNLQNGMRRLWFKGYLFLTKKKGRSLELIGTVGCCTSERIGGWARYVENPYLEVEVALIVNGKQVDTGKANRFRGDLLSVHPTGRCSFEFVGLECMPLQRGTLIQVVDRISGRNIPGSPKRVSG